MACKKSLRRKNRDHVAVGICLQVAHTFDASQQRFALSGFSPGFLTSSLEEFVVVGLISVLSSLVLFDGSPKRIYRPVSGPSLNTSY